MNRLRLGVIGTGLMFTTTHLPVLKRLDNLYEISALCNRNPNKAEQIASDIQGDPAIYSDYRALLASNTIDAVLISVPINLTAGFVYDALSAGKHVFSEKPIADKIQDGEANIALAEQQDLVYMVGENFRYRSQFRQVHDLVEEGAIGDPKVYRLNDMHYTYPGGLWSQTSWRQEGKHIGGYLVDGGTHIIAGMREMVRSKIERVHGLAASFNPELLSKQEDTLLLHLNFANGMIGQMALGYGAVDRDARKPKVYGTSGTLILERDTIELLPVQKGKEPVQIPINSSGDEFELQWMDFFEAVVDGKAPYSTAQAALEDIKVIYAGLSSAASGDVKSL